MVVITKHLALIIINNTCKKRLSKKITLLIFYTLFNKFLLYMRHKYFAFQMKGSLYGINYYLKPKILI